MDVVYILGSLSKWENNEIKYSLRSLEKNVINYGKVFVVGIFPEFLNKKTVIHIPEVDPFGHKTKNAINKILVACSDERISEDFILMNDDFIFLKEIENIVNRNNGSLDALEKLLGQKQSYYYTAIRETNKLLKMAGIEKPINYDAHYPIIINKKIFKDTMDLIDWRTNAYLYRSVYGNVSKLKSEKKPDIKIFNLKIFKENKDKDFISLDNYVVLMKEFQRWISNKFKTKSKYEN